MGRRRRKLKKNELESTDVKDNETNVPLPKAIASTEDIALTKEAEPLRNKTTKHQPCEKATPQAMETAPEAQPEPMDTQAMASSSQPSGGLPEIELPGVLETKVAKDEDGQMVEIADSESTTSASTIEFLMDDFEKEESIRGRQLSTPNRGKKSVDPSPNSTTSSRHSTPQRTSSRRQSTSPTHSGSSSVVSSSFPVRPGITWKAGARVEAMDFISKWYPARIVEINGPEMEALIHFEGWNARYDEWVPMTSDRLRPLARHSERRDKSKAIPKTEYKIGECVFAKWTDCRHYAARIITINPSGSYEVIFFDGFKKTIQPINVKFMPPEVQVEYGNAGLLPPVPKQLKKRVKDGSMESPGVPGTAGTPGTTIAPGPSRKSLDTPPQTNADHKAAAENAQKEKAAKKRGSASAGSGVKRSKMEPGSSKQTHESGMKPSSSKDKKSPDATATTTLGSGQDFNPIPYPDTKFETRKILTQASVTTRSHSADFSGRKHFKSVASTESKPEADGKARSDIKVEMSEDVTGSVDGPLEPDVSSGCDGSVGTTEALDTDSASDAGPIGRRQSYLMAMLQGALPYYRSSPLSSDKKVTQSSADGSHSVHATQGGSAMLDADFQVRAPKAFKVEEDHNQYKCPFEGCPKAFRKESLVEYHIKYYHTNDGKPVPPAPPRKRMKTNSVCSTDSEISVGGRSSTSKRKKRLSEVSLGSLPDATLERLQLQIEDSMGSDMLEDSLVGGSLEIDHNEAQVTDDSIALGEEAGHLKKDEEVVNCICQLNEENGLMIQCEVCLCWQHASCMELTDETLPKRYVCYVCLNPPGIRDSARFIYVQDWFREGKLARFNFLPVPETAEESSSRMLGLHELVGETHNVNRVLDSLRRKIHILQEKNHPEFHFWKKNWDREIEKKRQEAETADETGETSSQIKVEGGMDNDSQAQTSTGTVDLNVVKIEPGTENSAVSIDDAEASAISQQGIEVKEEVLGDTGEPSTNGEVDTSAAVDSGVPVADHPCEGAPPSSGLHDYSVNARSAPGSPQQVDGDPEELESDVALTPPEEDPLVNCEKNLLEHIMNMQDRLADRLALIDEHVTAMEELENMKSPQKDVLSDVPVLKKKLHHVINDLVKVKRMSRFH